MDDAGRTCPSCGSDVGDAARWCGRCGAALEADAAARVPAAVGPPQATPGEHEADRRPARTAPGPTGRSPAPRPRRWPTAVLAAALAAAGALALTQGTDAPENMLAVAGDATNRSSRAAPPPDLAEHWRTDRDVAGPRVTDDVEPQVLDGGHVAVGRHVLHLRRGRLTARPPGRLDGARFAVAGEGRLVRGDARDGEVAARLTIDGPGAEELAGGALAWVDGDPVLPVDGGGSARVDGDGRIRWSSPRRPVDGSAWLARPSDGRPTAPDGAMLPEPVAVDPADGTILARTERAVTSVVAASEQAVVVRDGRQLLGYRTASLADDAPVVLPGVVPPDWRLPLRLATVRIRLLPSGRLAVLDRTPGEATRARLVAMGDGAVRARIALRDWSPPSARAAPTRVALGDDGVVAVDRGALRRWTWDGADELVPGVGAEVDRLLPGTGAVTALTRGRGVREVVLRAGDDEPLDLPDVVARPVHGGPAPTGVADGALRLEDALLGGSVWLTVADGSPTEPVAPFGPGDEPDGPPPDGPAPELGRPTVDGRTPLDVQALELPGGERAWLLVDPALPQVRRADGAASVLEVARDVAQFAVPTADGPVLFTTPTDPDARTDAWNARAFGWDGAPRWQRERLAPIAAVGSAVLALQEDADGFPTRAELLDGGGRRLLSVPIGGARASTLPVLAGPLDLADGPVVVRVDRGAVRAVDAATGDPAWRVDLPALAEQTDLFDVERRVVVQPDQVVVPLSDGTVVALAAEDGEQLWRRRVGRVTAATGAGDQVLLARADGRVLRLGADGEVVGRLRLPGPAGALAVVDQHLVAVLADAVVGYGPRDVVAPSDEIVVVP